MSTIENFEFISNIPANETNATTMQFLTLQDLIAGKFKNPTETANPYNSNLVRTQLDKLTDFPDRYSGYVQENGLIVAYMKSTEWLVDDETPFVYDHVARRALKKASKARGGSLDPKALGIFGLVVDRDVEKDAREEMFYTLLNRSITQGLAHAAGVVNIVIHEHDPVLPIARDLRFEPVGAMGVAAGAPGLLQQRYQRNISE